MRRDQVIRTLFRVLVGLILGCNLLGAQTNYLVPITFTVSNTAIDRIIGSQWSTIPHSWSGPMYWGTYSLTLNQPTIILADNAIKIRMNLNVTSPIYNGSFTMTPTLIVPPTTVSASNVITQYQDLQQQINNYISDSGLRSIIYQQLSPISWMIFQGQILNQSTTLVSPSSYVGWIGIPTLAFNISNNTVVITVTPTITAAAPSYHFYYNRPDYNDFGIMIYSNDAISITYLRIYNSNKSQLYAGSQSASSVWDNINQRYVTTLTVYVQSPANNYDQLNYQVRINRQSSESLWGLLTYSMLGYPITWVPMYITTELRGD